MCNMCLLDKNIYLQLWVGESNINKVIGKRTMV